MVEWHYGLIIIQYCKVIHEAFCKLGDRDVGQQTCSKQKKWWDSWKIEWGGRLGSEESPKTWKCYIITAGNTLFGSIAQCCIVGTVSYSKWDVSKNPKSTLTHNELSSSPRHAPTTSCQSLNVKVGHTFIHQFPRVQRSFFVRQLQSLTTLTPEHLRLIHAKSV